ncbi:MAG: hypothetical protein IJ661_12365 [Lachnospiraceae bacterium]|nr:hypothetical protein [Lachnospiraceae bacterium]
MFLDVIDPVVDESKGFYFGAGVLPVIIIVSVIVVLILSTLWWDLLETAREALMRAEWIMTVK